MSAQIIIESETIANCLRYCAYQTKLDEQLQRVMKEEGRKQLDASAET